MFIPKPSSKQKHMKTTQEHETENAVRGSSWESSIFHPKTQFSYTQIPNLIGNITSIWTSIFYEFYGLSTLLTTISTCSIIKSGFKPEFSILHEQQPNYMLNSISELYNLRLENISPTLTLDWWLQGSTNSSLLLVLLFSRFSSFSPKPLNLICGCSLPFISHTLNIFLNQIYVFSN